LKTTFLHRATIFTLTIGLGAFIARAAGPNDLIVNGNFETGTLAGWTVVHAPSSAIWAVNDGTYDPAGPGGTLPPISGAFDVVGSGGGGFRSLRQTITIPAGILSARLSWNDRIRNTASIYADPGQEFRVVIRNSVGTVVLHEVYSTTPGDPLVQLGPNPRSGDLTGFFKLHAGETVIVSFEEQDTFNPFYVTLDDIHLIVSQLPIDKDDCKGGSWQTFVNVNTGQKIFKNQGDCVSFVESKGANPPAFQK
jgi:hypothetical protein